LNHSEEVRGGPLILALEPLLCLALSGLLLVKRRSLFALQLLRL